MTFGTFVRNLGGANTTFGDSILGFLCPNYRKYKDFINNYVNDARQGGRFRVSDEETIAAYYQVFPDERPLSELTVAEVKALFGIAEVKK